MRNPVVGSYPSRTLEMLLADDDFCGHVGCVEDYLSPWLREGCYFMLHPEPDFSFERARWEAGLSESQIERYFD